MSGSLPALPEAIAPSLATTPDFARRASWSHAIEVKIILCIILALKFESVCSLISFSQVVTSIVLIYLCDLWSIFEGVVSNIYISREKNNMLLISGPGTL